MALEHTGIGNAGELGIVQLLDVGSTTIAHACTQAAYQLINDNWNASSARSFNWKEGYGYTIATEMYSAGIDRLTHQPLSFSVSESTEGVHIHIIDAELMGKGEKEKKDLYIEGVQNNGITNH